MATFFLFGKYSASSIKDISAKRSQAAAETVKKLGGELKSLHALLGEHDLVMIVECSLSLARHTGIAFTTAPAIPVEQFDKLAAET
jgi:uncharacterized protein with GYD domain